MKLGTKINLVLVIVTTLILTIAFWVIVDMVATSLRQQVVDDSQGVVNILGDQIERTFKQIYIQQDYVQTTIDKTASTAPEVKYIKVNDARGLYVAANDHALIGQKISTQDAEILKKIELSRKGIDTESKQGTFYVYERHVPVFFKGDDTTSEIVNIFAVSVISRSKTEADKEEAKKILQVISRFMDQGMRSNVVARKSNIDVLLRIVNSVKDFYFFHNFIIFDEKLNIVASTQNDPAELNNDAPEYKQARLDVVSGKLTPPYEIDRLHTMEDGKTIDIIMRLNPVFSEVGGKKQIVGLTEIHVFKDIYKARVAEVKTRMLWIGIIFTIVLVVVLAVILETEVVGPIRRYSLVAQKIAGGDLNQVVEHTSNDEIGQFGNVFNSMVGNLREFDKLKSDFISVAAHQLRTPLSGVKWVLKLLLDGDLGVVTDTQKGMLKRGYDTNEKMIQLVNDLLNVSRIENGKFGYKFEKNDFNKLLSNLMENIVLPSKERNILVTLDNRAPDLQPFLFDPEKLLIALQNIVDNAMKYTLPGGKVNIEVGLQGDYIQVKISDTGVGIPKEDIGKLFSKFFRAANVVHLQTDGSGLGLFIVKSIIMRHGGQIWVDSTEGKGTTFTVVVPVIAALLPKEDEQEGAQMLPNTIPN